MKELFSFLSTFVLGIIAGVVMGFGLAFLIHWNIPPTWLAAIAILTALAVVVNDLRKEI